MDNPQVESIDGEVFEQLDAQKICKRFFYAGFAFLPLMWLANVWLFWPDFRTGHDLVIQKYTRWSAIGFVVVMVLFLPWFLLYIIAGSSILSTNVYNTLDVTRFDLSALGIGL